jgi:hypothetical protein
MTDFELPAIEVVDELSLVFQSKLASTRMVRQWRADRAAGDAAGADQLADASKRLELKPRFLEMAHAGGQEKMVDRMMGARSYTDSSGAPQVSDSRYVKGGYHKPDSNAGRGDYVRANLDLTQEVSDRAQHLPGDAGKMVTKQYGYDALPSAHGPRFKSYGAFEEGVRPLADQEASKAYTNVLQNVSKPLEQQGYQLKDAVELQGNGLWVNPDNVVDTNKGTRVIDYAPKRVGEVSPVAAYRKKHMLEGATSYTGPSFERSNGDALRREVHNPTGKDLQGSPVLTPRESFQRQPEVRKQVLQRVPAETTKAVALPAFDESTRKATLPSLAESTRKAVAPVESTVQKVLPKAAPIEATLKTIARTTKAPVSRSLMPTMTGLVKKVASVPEDDALAKTACASFLDELEKIGFDVSSLSEEQVTELLKEAGFGAMLQKGIGAIGGAARSVGQAATNFGTKAVGAFQQGAQKAVGAFQQGAQKATNFAKNEYGHLQSAIGNRVANPNVAMSGLHRMVPHDVAMGAKAGLGGAIDYAGGAMKRNLPGVVDKFNSLKSALPQGPKLDPTTSMGKAVVKTVGSDANKALGGLAGTGVAGAVAGAVAPRLVNAGVHYGEKAVGAIQQGIQGLRGRLTSAVPQQMAA